MPQGRIMIVEDESLVAEDLQHCLEQSGYQVVGIADTYESARALAETSCPDHALLDIRLKGQRDGIELALELCRNGIGYVYLTSHSDEGTLARAEVTEPLGYMLKPFGAREMLPVLRTALYRHAADRRHRRMEHWLRTTLRSIGDGVIATDKDTLITYANPVAEQILGRRLRDFAGEPLSQVLQLVQAGTGNRQPCIARRAMVAGGIVCLEPGVELLRGDGSRMPIDDCAAPVFEDSQQVAGAVVVLRDASARVQVERQRLEAERRMQDAERLESIGVLASGVAHELDARLSAILAAAASCRTLASGAARTQIAEIEANARAAEDLCRRMRDGAGALPIAASDVSLDAVVTSCVAREKALADPKVAIVVEPAAASVSVRADEVLLRQMLHHLLRDAADRCVGRDATIRVTREAVDLPGSAPPHSAAARLRAGHYVRLEIADDGPELAADGLARVFEPFSAAGLSERGLGLASAHDVVHRHGGCIEAESGPGKGTCFRVFWPASVTPY
jgi:PAS domain S-box-containing protein